ncbi:arginine--tRNA ligase [Emticicia sp. CRIBPO]|uniref:arginine--tRNA ligase n=1 Tax=Emticicia sp. CRIBPO TaxID=2683258 RepID=UPI001412FD08|nr:arginine--tRNA ligase [Emticicia sp. CRIBPO]NBA84905.1 arginine--tRNA ligase [Emticicia sp. CRIBPO]
MDLELNIKSTIKKAIQELYGLEEEIQLQPTRKDFEGTYTFVIFPLVKQLKKSPADIGTAIGDYLISNSPDIKKYNIVQGFLNLVPDDSVWFGIFNALLQNPDHGKLTAKNESVMVEYSSPNTNKPLHLGHLRNNFLGYSVANILEASGYEVIKSCLINDRGIHICKSMLAYQKFGNGETPESSGLKGDHLAGKYYVAFDRAYKTEVDVLVQQGIPEDEAKKTAPIMKEAQEMLLKWESGDDEVIALWKKMNAWVFAGFNETYKTIGVSFDKTYYESNTYLLGKDIVEEGLSSGVFYQKDDKSVWIDLTHEGLDQKLVLRGDGTSVYITQDLGTTDLKFKDFSNNRSIWVVGNEQDYHFQVLFAIMKRLGRSYADGCYHLSYGMVDLPSGKMKSREGTVVDADELVAEMIATAEQTTRERGKIDDFEEEEAQKLFKMLALGALKYFLLKVEPKKRMLFNPAESIDFQGNTGPFIQYTHARIKSILRKAESQGAQLKSEFALHELAQVEIDLIYLVNEYHNILEKAGNDYAPSVVANYCYDLAKTFNSFYAELSVMNEEDTAKKELRLSLIRLVADTLKKGMGLLGIEVPERM